VYTLLPYDPRSPGYFETQALQSQAIVRAVCESGVAHVVAISSLGAQHHALEHDANPIRRLRGRRAPRLATRLNSMFVIYSLDYIRDS